MFINNSRYRLILFLLIFISVNSYSQVRLPKLVSDGMVLQRDCEIKIWGWAGKDEKVTVHFLNSTYETNADGGGNWIIMLPKLQAGGPYEMQVAASNSITIRDIMIGEVWVCSGQSNMELPMKRVSWNYPGEIENSENKYIRQFIVPQRYNFSNPEKDLSGGSWKNANPENTPDFSAVAYFYAKEIYNKFKVSVGLINASLGGSPVQAWISEESLKKFPKYYNEALMFRDNSLIKKIEDSDNARNNVWYNLLHQKDEGFKDSQNIWYTPTLNTSDWKSMKVPGYWANTDLGSVNGVVWFRRKFEVPSAMLNKPAILIMGRIVDADSVFINGKFVGTVSYQYPPRRYVIPSGLLTESENTIVVRVISNSGNGGFVLDKKYAVEAGGTSINLEGDWKYKLGAEMPSLASQTFIRWKPLGLYNSMIAPLLNYKISGVIWYQGEANAWAPEEYKDLFSTMIYDWRSKWNEGDFPFLFVQLPNFMEAKPEPSESSWASLREAQLKTLFVTNTGMAVAIDIGEWNDIHPLNKKDVSKRLFLAAEKIAYGDKQIVSSGPIYQSMKISGNKIVITFSNTGSGLIAKGNGELKCFAIANADKKFVWARAKIENDKVIVWSESIKKPVAVRYSWADNPEGANLYNQEGLPASPFRTDDH